MSGNVINLRSSDVKLSKMFCACGHTLEYWLGDNDCAYGICPSCDCNNPVEMTLKGEE
jgi:hypothetical protein